MIYRSSSLPLRVDEVDTPGPSEAQLRGLNEPFEGPWLPSRTVSTFVTYTPLALADVVTLTLASLLATLVGATAALGISPLVQWMCVVGVALPILGLSGVNDVLDPVAEARRVLRAVFRSGVVLCIAGLALLPGPPIGALFASLALVIGGSMVLAPLVRWHLRHVLARTSWWGEPVVVTGHLDRVEAAWRFLEHNRPLGLRPCSTVLWEDENRAADRLGEAANESRTSSSKTNDVRWAVIAAPDNGDGLADLVSAHGSHFHRLLIFTPAAAVVSPSRRLGALHTGSSTALVVRDAHDDLLGRAMKRVFDLSLGILATIVLLPVIVLVALAIKLESRGPVLYGHKRLGRDGRHIKVWKFRTMAIDADRRLEELLSTRPDLREQWDINHKLDPDPRVTRIGLFLRKFSLDELPQLWNVLRGQMSLIGPRPIVDAEIEKYGEVFGTYTQVKPGLSGLWQISGRNDTTYEERVELDRQYVWRWSIWLDLYILALTPMTVLRKTGAR